MGFQDLPPLASRRRVLEFSLAQGGWSGQKLRVTTAHYGRCEIKGARRGFMIALLRGFVK